MDHLPHDVIAVEDERLWMKAGRDVLQDRSAADQRPHAPVILRDLERRRLALVHADGDDLEPPADREIGDQPELLRAHDAGLGPGRDHDRLPPK